MIKLTLLLALIFTAAAFSEPYIAIQTGYQCGMCHTNPTGGGQRTPFGNQFAIQQLTSGSISATNAAWTGMLNDVISIGGNARMSASQLTVDDKDDNVDFGVERASLYLNFNLSEQVSFYLDQQVAPSTSINRELWARINHDNWYLKAGKIFTPFGWRIEDDSAFIRQVTGINFNSGDMGIEVGFTGEHINFQLAATNGNGGASDIDDNKQLTSRLVWIETDWRVGFSLYNNNTKFGERNMYGIFAGAKLWIISWLFEYDVIKDTGFDNLDITQDLALIEANVLLLQGHNLKLTFETLILAQENRDRLSIVYEYFPIAFTQIRAGFRYQESDNDLAIADSEESFVELHIFF
ncbi:MAG: OprO/OprP family phosphate-selective porin [Colwellia sp.]|nr:OprO/OprP family phosphate-selective porin [Colwellia sp.]